jgi:hypothetical protein
MMKYQLVLQFPGDVLLDAGGPKALEQDLIATLGDDVYVDGYDLGADNTSLFIFTPDPLATFARASQVLERWDLLDAVAAAHRPTDTECYTVIWPEGCHRTFRIA